MLLDGAFVKDIEKLLEHLKLIRRNKIQRGLLPVSHAISLVDFLFPVVWF
jgi:hypothetical protein